MIKLARLHHSALVYVKLKGAFTILKKLFYFVLWVHAKSLQLCLTLCDPADCSLPGSSVHGILQARTLEWVAISFSRGSFWPRDRTHVSYVSCTDRRALYHCATWKAILYWGIAAVHGVAKSRTRLSDFTFTFHFPALEKEMATHSSVLAWRIPGTGEPGGLPSMGSHRVGHDWSDLAAAAAMYLE